MGRFLTEDPAEGKVDNPPSLQRYLYAYANPTVYTDPDGLYSWDDFKEDAVQAATVAVEFTKNNVKSVGKLATGTLDLATLGSVSAIKKQVDTFQNTRGNLVDKVEAAGKVSTLSQRAHVVTFGLSDAPDRLQRLKELTGVTQIQQAGTHYGEALAERDPEKALQATGELLGGAGQVANTVLLVGAPAAKAGLIPLSEVAASTTKATMTIEDASGVTVQAVAGDTTRGAAAQVSEPTSGAQFGIRIATEGEASPATEEASALLNRVRAGSGDLAIGRGEVGAQDEAALTRQTGNEFAIYRDRDTGQLFLRELGPTHGEIPPNSRLIIHSQPGSTAMAVRPSGADREALEALGQRSSVIINEAGNFAGRFGMTSDSDNPVVEIGPSKE